MAHLEATIRSKGGPILPGATVSVFEAGTQTLASLFSDEALSVPIDNPTLADSEGVVNFYVAANEYDLLIQRFDIKDRLLENVSIIESSDSGNPTGPASGDLSGDYPSPTVDGIGGIAIVGTPMAGDILSVDDIGGSLEWGPPVFTSDPTEIILTANQFLDFNGFTVITNSTGVAINLSAGSPTNWICTTKLPPSFYGVPLDFDIMAVSTGVGDTAFLTFDIANTVSANTPAHSVSQAIPVAGAPGIITIGTDSTLGAGFGGMVHVILGRDPTQDNMTSNVRVYFVRIRPTP